MCKTNVKLQIISTNNFLDYVNNVDEPDDKYSQEKTVQKTFVAKLLTPHSMSNFGDDNML